MSLREEIEKYVPYNEQEVADKQMILKYMNTFEDCLTRENKFGHFTSSAFVVNPTKDKVLFAYHNIYDSWAWLGGHADGDDDFRRVAMKEAKEESGIEELKLLTNEIFSIDIISVPPHIKRGKFVSAHVHLEITSLIEADDTQLIHCKPDENKGVAWIPIDHLKEYVSETIMIPIYHKLIEKMRKIT